MDTKISLCCRLSAIGQLAKVDLVEVHFEDGIFAIRTGQTQGEDNLAQLASETTGAGLLGRQEDVTGQLLSDGAAPGDDVASTQVEIDSPKDTPQVHARVTVEITVLDSDDSLAQVQRKFIQRNAGAPASPGIQYFEKEPAVPVVDLGGVG